MALEIERKFLVKPGFDIAGLATRSVQIGQAYLSDNPDSTVRVRLAGDCGFITVKSRNRGAVRGEWEYSIPAEDARRMMALPGVPGLIKTRYYVPYGNHTWEVDVFGGRLAGLVVAEIELQSEDEPFELPPFAGAEVTGDSRYYNSVLVHALSVP